MKASVQSIVGLMLIITVFGLTLGGLTRATSTSQPITGSSILVVQNADQRLWFMDNALNQLGIGHDTVTVSQFASMNISQYKIILVGCQIGNADAVDAYLDNVSAEVGAWVNAGGCIMVSGQYVNASAWDLNGALRYNQGSGYYSWLPGSPGFVSFSTDGVHVVNNTNPITASFTDQDLSNWGSSADGYFILTSGETPLAVQAGYPDHPALYAATFGAGKVVATGLDPDYHGFIYNGQGDYGKMMAQALLRNILTWFNGGPVNSPPNTGSAPAILVVQNAEQRLWFMDNALNQLGIGHDTVTVSQFASMNISQYKIILVGCQIGNADAVDAYLDNVSAEVGAWVNAGGCIMVSGQYVNASAWDLNGALCYNQGSGYYSWLPGSPGFVSFSTDGVHVVNNTNPITASFTDQDLSNWGSSADGYFILTSGETPLAVQAGYPDHPALYAATFGAGKVVATGLDPDYHGFIYNGQGDYGKMMAQALLRNILTWFNGGPVNSTNPPPVITPPPIINPPPITNPPPLSSSAFLISPSLETLNVNDSFTVAVNLTNAQNLFSWQVVLKYNGTDLKLNDMWIPDDNVFAGHSVIPEGPIAFNAADGSLFTVIGGMLLGTDLIANVDSGVLCNANFTVMNTGQSLIQLAAASNPAIVGKELDWHSFWQTSNDALFGAEEDALGSNCTVSASQLPTQTVNTPDAEVMNISPASVRVYQGQTANINVTISNMENTPENVWVTLYYDATSGKSINAYPVYLQAKQTCTLQFTWNTAGIPCTNYTLTAVTTVNTDAGTLTSGTIAVRLMGDVNGDGTVNMKDLALIARALGSTPTSPNWNPAADLNGDGKVNLKDLALAARTFGRHYP